MTPGGGTLEIDWKAPTDTGETAITSYDLRYIRDDVTDRSDDNWSVVTGVGTPSNRSYTITGLTGGVKYEFQLRAHNDSGHGPWSLGEADEAHHGRAVRTGHYRRHSQRYDSGCRVDCPR